MGKGFKDIHISFVGSHEYSDKIPQWVKAHGGTFSREMNENVTHLIASETAVKKNVHAVQQARDRHINLVNYDWLEDSLLAKPVRPIRVGPYLWDRIQKAKPEKAEKLEKKKGKPGRKPGQKNAPKHGGEIDAEEVGYHLYVDDTSGPAYNATLVRSYLAKTRIFRETFVTAVYETNDAPKTYATFVKYSRARASHKDILAPRGSTLEFATFTFEKFFKMKTGLEWKDRFDDSKVPVAGTVDDGGPIKPEGGWFVFKRPVGIMGSLNVDAERKVSIE